MKRLNLTNFNNKQKEIITLLKQGKSNKEIASNVGLTIGSVKNYLTKIYVSASVKTRAEFMANIK